MFSIVVKQPLLPNPHDILLGKGKIQQQHPGNLALMDIVSQKYGEYKGASRFEKTCIAMDIVDAVKKRRGRFLKRTESNDDWVEVDDPVARDTVSHRFRNEHGRAGPSSRKASRERANKRARR